MITNHNMGAPLFRDHPVVYVVDDDEWVRDSLCVLLQSDGFVFTAFASGIEFMGYKRPEIMSCIVLDVEMPGMSGIELLEYIRDEKLIVARIVMTGRPNTTVRRAVVRHGAVLFEKPFDPDHLLRAIRDGLRGGQLH